jgi:hypothetical protein
MGHGTRPLSCIVMMPSYSRTICARFILDQTLEILLRGHVEAFQTSGLVLTPKGLLAGSDPMRTIQRPPSRPRLLAFDDAHRLEGIPRDGSRSADRLRNGRPSDIALLAA